MTKLGVIPALQVRSDWTSLIDEWAGRFFHELDYEREAINSTVFKQQMAGLDGIFVADVNVQLSNKEVLVTSWVPGTCCNRWVICPWCGCMRCWPQQQAAAGDLGAA